MAEISVRMLLDVALYLIPIALIISNFLACSTYGYDSPQCLNFFKRLLQFTDQLFPVRLDFPPLGNINEGGHSSCEFS